MNEFIMIKVMNEATIRTLNEMGKDVEKNTIIRELLKDEGYFFKIEKEKAFKILSCVGIKTNKMDEVYGKLIDSKMYYELVKNKIIDPKNDNLVIKYKKRGI